MGRRLALAFAAVASWGALASGAIGGCLPGSGPPLLDGADGAGSSTNLEGDAGLPKSDVDLGDPFALEGVQPSHGPFNGGTRAVLGGRGFTSKLRVFLGGVEVPTGSVVASDPTRAAIITPPGPPGYVDVKIRDDATAKERVLPKGFYYDAFVVDPSSGATSGGTRIALTGSGTTWDVGVAVAIGGVPCGNVVVASPTHVECVTPAGSPGTKDVTVTTTDGNTLQARDAFTYSDSTDGYRGGLSGGVLAGRVRVLAFDSATGTPLPGVTVIAGSSLATGVVQHTASTGVTEFNGLPGSKVTITVAGKCLQPVTFVDVPVDTVTAYLDPVLDLSCVDFMCLIRGQDPCPKDPPSTGGRGGRYGGIIEGQLSFPGTAEFQRQGWTTVPAPTKPTERRAAYVFETTSSPGDAFQLPPASEAITPETAGTSGYSYSVVVFPGNATLYVIAGLEDRSEVPPTFVPYAMGVARGISVPPQTRVTGVDVKMDILFDHQVTMAPVLHAPGPRGPDRFRADVALTLGTQRYATLPLGSRVIALPAPATIPFVGVPSLDHGITGEQYVLGGTAATGVGLQVPASLVARIRTSNANDPVVLGGFLGVPILSQPADGVWNGTHVAFSGAEGPVDMTLVTINSGYGLKTWTIVAPGAATSFDVPDLGASGPGPLGPDPLGLVSGSISTSVHVARIDGFDYGRFRYGQLAQSAWNAAAFDTLSGAY